MLKFYTGYDGVYKIHLAVKAYYSPDRIQYMIMGYHREFHPVIKGGLFDAMGNVATTEVPIEEAVLMDEFKPAFSALAGLNNEN